MSGVTKFLFGDDDNNSPAGAAPVTPTAPTTPATVPPPPARSADQITASSNRQVARFYGAADAPRTAASVNGTPQDVSGTSRVARFLGNVGRI